MINFKNQVAQKISAATEIDVAEIETYLETPPNSDLGDYAFPCFKLAKTLKKAPPIIAQELKEKIELDGIIDRAEIAGGYLNFYVNKQELTKTVLEEIENKKELYGSSNVGNGKNIIVEYSSPNIAKPFHIGHLRNTTIGATLYNIYKFLGYNTTGINHLGDYGTQFGKLIEGYKRWGTEYKVDEDPINELMKIYVRITEACKNDPEILEACRDNFKKLEDGDEYCTKLWEKFRKVSLDEFQKIYELLGVKFDSLKGEAFYTDKMDAIVEILENAGVVKESEGARIVDLEDVGKGVLMLKKSNDSTTYATRDLAAVKYRAETYDFDRCLYVIAYEQALHFRQVFEVAKYLGIPEKCVKGLEHVQYGMVRLPSGKMSTREGTVVKVEDLINEAIARVTDIINQKDPNMENKEENAKKIALGAIVFNNLANNAIKDQVFEWENVLNFQGETGPYIQYIYVRTKSVLEKVGYIPKLEDVDISLLSDKESINIISKIYKFEDVLKAVINKSEPVFLTRYLIELAQNYSNFYNENKIIVEDEKIKNARAYLTYVVGTVLKTGMKLLGIQMPDKM